MRTYEVVFTCKGKQVGREFVSARSELHAEVLAERQAPRGMHWDVVEASAVGG